MLTSLTDNNTTSVSVQKIKVQFDPMVGKWSAFLPIDKLTFDIIRTNRQKCVCLTVVFLVLIFILRNSFGRYSISFTIDYQPDVEKQGVALAELEFDHDRRIFVYKNRPILFVFWNNFSSVPPYVKLSLQTIQCHNNPDVYVAVLNESFVTSHLFLILHDQFHRLKSAHKADYIRCSVLLKYGGMYVDADIIQMTPVKHLFDGLADYEMVTFSEHSAHVYTAFGFTILGPIRAESQFLQLWKLRVDKIITQKFLNYTDSYPIGWFEILRNSLKSVYENMALYKDSLNFNIMNGSGSVDQLWYVFGEPTFIGPFWPRNDTELKRLTDKLNTSSEFIIYHQNEVSWYPETKIFKNMSITTFVQHPILINQIFKISLQRCGERNKREIPVCFSNHMLSLLN